MSSDALMLSELNVAFRGAYLSLIDEFRAVGEDYHQNDRRLAGRSFLERFVTRFLNGRAEFLKRVAEFNPSQTYARCDRPILLSVCVVIYS